MSNQAAVVGKNTNGIYKQAFVLGEFLLVLLIQGEEDVNLEFGRNFVAMIEEIVSQTPDISGQQLQELVFDHVSKENLKLEMMIGKIHEQKLTISSLGTMSARLVRKNKFITLIDSGNPATIAGPLQQGDLLILGTSQFFEMATTEFLSEGGKLNPEGIRERLASVVESSQKSETVAGLLFEVNLIKITQEPEETLQEASIEEGKDMQVETEPQTSPFKSYGVPQQSTFSKIAGIFTDLPHFIRRTGLQIRRESLDQQRSQTRRRWMFLVLAGFITLVCIISFQLRSKVTEGQMKVVSDLNTQATEAVNAADKLIGLNDQIARETLMAARGEIVTKANNLLGVGWENKNDPAQKKVKQILATIDDHLSKAMKIYKVESLTPFTDFSLLKSGPNIVAASLLEGKILVLDQANGSIYSVATDTKTAAIVGGSSDLKNGKAVDLSLTRAYVLAHDIFSVDIESTSQPRKVIGADSSWGNIIGIRSFAGNLYLLDTSANQIWKYQGGETGFASRSGYLQTGLSVDLSKVVDFTIDGSVYVLSKSGNVVKFSGGTTTDFKISGNPESLKNPVSIFSSENSKGIYVFDEGENKVIVFDKSGIYNSQYAIPKISEKIIKVMADEAVKKIFLATPTKIYAIELKQ